MNLFVKKTIDYLLDYKLYIVVAIFLGRSSLSRIGIPFDYDFSAMYLLLFLTFLFFLISKNKIEVNNIPKSSIIIILMYLYFSFTTFWSFEVVHSFFNYLIPNVAVIGIVLFLTLTIDNEEKFNKLLMCLFVVIFIIGISAIPTIPSGRVRPIIGGGPNTFYRFMLQGYLLYLIIFKGKYKKTIWIPIILIFLGLSTGSRGFIVNILLIFFIQAIIGKNWKKKVLKIFLAASIFLLLANNVEFQQIINKIVPQMNRVWVVFDVKELLESTSGEGRVDLIDTAINEYEKETYFKQTFGLGTYASIKKSGQYPHNLFVEVLVDYGVIGIFILLSVFLSYVFSTYKVIKKTKTYQEKEKIVYLNAVVIIYFISSMLSGDIYDSRLIFIFIAINGIYYKISKRKRVKI